MRQDYLAELLPGLELVYTSGTVGYWCAEGGDVAKNGADFYALGRTLDLVIGAL